VILILSSPRDVHARAVLKELRAIGADGAIVDTGSCGSGNGIHVALDAGPGGWIQFDGTRVAAEAVSSVWLRRPSPPALPEVTEPESRRLALAEWQQTMDGWLLSLPGRLVNHPMREAFAPKPRQLQIARAVGLRTPETLISNDRNAALAFVERHDGDVVHKTLTTLPGRLLETRRWEAEDVERLDDLEAAPTILQSRIGGLDIRVTVFGDRSFAASIETPELDSRLDGDAPHRIHELPPDVERRLLELMGQLGLAYGAIDLKLSEEGEYVFLEVNPRGQFLYVEILTGMPLTRAMAELLAAVAR
jgi:hypothetical protein